MMYASFNVEYFGNGTARTLWKAGTILNPKANLNFQGIVQAPRPVVDLPDKPSNRQWMKQFAKRWKSRLEQLELWMVSYAIEIE